MSANPFSLPNPFEAKPKKKRVRLTAKERIYVWEHPEIYGRTCSICDKKITKLSDLELDHTKPYSKGGTKLALAHRDCNRMKGSRNLRDVQKKMKFKTTKKKKQTKTKSKKKKTTSPFDITLPKTKFPLF
ncbi:HNH endonuclease [Candidatus Bathyarchaeota archaeon]|nr:HNH endonuclease [Candidatus Bathyarchaeota archaeon]